MGKNVKRKTDRDDALKLAKLAALGQLTKVHVPDAAGREYRGIVKYRKHVQSRLNAVQNRVRALFQHQGIAIPSGKKAWTKEGLAKLSAYRQPFADCSPDQLWQGELDLELDAREALLVQLKTVEQQLEKLAQRNEQVQRLARTPGVGRVTAEVVVAFIDDPQRFSNSRQVAAYAGLVPSLYESGTMSRQGSITKRGPRLLRAILIEACWAMLRYNDWAKETFERIKGGQKTRSKQAIVALARRVLIRLWAMMRDETEWCDDGVAPVAPQGSRDQEVVEDTVLGEEWGKMIVRD